jgi:hypothetical protein
MSCAFLNCSQTCGGPEGSETSFRTCPYEDLANGLHAMAQPLTVLRGALGAWKLRGSLQAEKDRYLEMTSRQVERMSNLLSCLQDVLDTAENDSNWVNVDIGELIGLVLEDMSSVLREEGVGIDVTGLDRQPVKIHGHADRTERAIRAALRVAASVSSPEGLVRLSVRPCETSVEVIVESTSRRENRHEKNLDFAGRLNLSLVETNIRSQGGTCEFVENPLCIVFALPAQRQELSDGALALHCIRMDIPS